MENGENEYPMDDDHTHTVTPSHIPHPHVLVLRYQKNLAYNLHRIMFSLSRSMRSPAIRVCERFITRQSKAVRSFSQQLPPDDPQAQFQPSPPEELNMEMAIGIQDANQLFLKHGIGKQRLELLATDTDMPLVIKWQRMMQIYLGMQREYFQGHLNFFW